MLAHSFQSFHSGRTKDVLLLHEGTEKSIKNKVQNVSDNSFNNNPYQPALGVRKTVDRWLKEDVRRSTKVGQRHDILNDTFHA